MQNHQQHSYDSEGADVSFSSSNLASRSSTAKTNNTVDSSTPSSSHGQSQSPSAPNTDESSHYIPSDLDPPLLRSPLYSADAMVLLAPHLIDAISGSLPADAWDWQSIPVNLASTGSMSASDPSSDPQNALLTVEGNLVKDSTDGKRGHSVLEILTTERTYYQELGIIINVCRQGLIDKEILNKIAINNLFAGMDELYSLHTMFLTKLEEIVSVDSWSPTESSIGRLFLEHKEEMVKHYVSYINNHSSANKTMSEEEGRNPEFKKFLHDCQRSNDTRRTELKDLLIRPMQRMTKYPLLLKELSKRTPENHPDSTNIRNAWEAMSDLAATVNEKMATTSMQTALFKAFEETAMCPVNLISSKRRCVMDIDAIDKVTQKPIHIYLCSDLIMIAHHMKEKTGGFFATGKSAANEQQHYKFWRWIDLLEIQLEELPNDWIRINISEDRRSNSLTTFPAPSSQPTAGSSPNVFEFKIDSQAVGSRRGEFMRAFLSELKTIRTTGAVRNAAGGSAPSVMGVMSGPSSMQSSSASLYK